MSMSNHTIDKRLETFFLKSVSKGAHNVKFSFLQIGLFILSCIRSLESFEEGANALSPQTLRDRLDLNGDWLDLFQDTMLTMAKKMVKQFPSYRWTISIDEKFVPFFGDREKLNGEFINNGMKKYVHGYKAKKAGATGSFGILVISLNCKCVRIPIFLKLIAVGDTHKSWVKEHFAKLIEFVPNPIILADRGFGLKCWYHQVLQELGVKSVTRMAIKSNKVRGKLERGLDEFQYSFGEGSENKVLLRLRCVRVDDQIFLYSVTGVKQKGMPLHTLYLERWRIENTFKDGDRIRLPTSSRNPLMRLYTLTLDLFLFALWQEKLLKKQRVSIRSFLKGIINQICELFDVILTHDGQLLKKPPPS